MNVWFQFTSLCIHQILMLYDIQDPSLSLWWQAAHTMAECRGKCTSPSTPRPGWQERRTWKLMVGSWEYVAGASWGWNEELPLCSPSQGVVLSSGEGPLSHTENLMALCESAKERNTCSHLTLHLAWTIIPRYKRLSYDIRGCYIKVKSGLVC